MILFFSATTMNNSNFSYFNMTYAQLNKQYKCILSEEALNLVCACGSWPFQAAFSTLKYLFLRADVKNTYFQILVCRVCVSFTLRNNRAVIQCRAGGERREEDRLERQEIAGGGAGWYLAWLHFPWRTPATHIYIHTHTHWATTGVRVAVLLVRVSDFTAYWVVAFSFHQAPLFQPFTQPHTHTHTDPYPLYSVHPPPPYFLHFSHLFFSTIWKTF